MNKRSVSLPIAVLVAVVALVVGSFGTATAAGITSKQVKKIAAKVVTQKAATLSVANATTADHATSADSATTSTLAATATTANGVKNDAITGSSVKDGSLSAADLAAGTIPVVMWARVNAVTGALTAGSHAVSASKTGTGQYTVTFDRAMADCAITATPYLSTYASIFIAGFSGANGIAVFVKDPTGTTYADYNFNVIATC